MIRGKKVRGGREGKKIAKGRREGEERSRVITGSLLEDRWKNLQGNSIIPVSGRFELQVSDTRRAFQCEFGSNRCRHAGVATVAARRFQWEEDGGRRIVLQMTGLRERYAYRVPVEAFEICIAPREEKKTKKKKKLWLHLLRDLRTLRNVALERCLSVEM